MVYPALIENVAFLRTGWFSAGAVGYLNVMFVKLIDVLQVNLSTGSKQLRTSGTLSITSKINTPKVFEATIA